MVNGFIGSIPFEKVNNILKGVDVAVNMSNITNIGGMIVKDKIVDAIINGAAEIDLSKIFKKAVKEQVVQENPEISTFSDKGQRVRDLYGNVGKVTPDGEIIEENALRPKDNSTD
jgi:hypothetical protein